PRGRSCAHRPFRSAIRRRETRRTGGPQSLPLAPPHSARLHGGRMLLPLTLRKNLFRSRSRLRIGGILDGWRPKRRTSEKLDEKSIKDSRNCDGTRAVLRPAQALRRHTMRQPKKASPRVEQLEPKLLMSSFYVAPTGSDRAIGSSQAPWLTLQHAAN